MRLDGSTGRVQRTVDIAEFNRPRKVRYHPTTRDLSWVQTALTI
jgi:hypothetical protein